jgi:tetratricopeptide (TPR) repeat protein
MSLPVQNPARRLRRVCLLSVLVALLAAGAAVVKAQQVGESGYTGITVEASPQIFTTMCALDAAGFDADESTIAEMPDRLALRADLLKMQGPATDALRQFYRDHALGNPGETLSRYITFALVIGPPPQFQLLGNRESLPPDVLALDGLQDLLPNFYREARLDVRWARIEPEYEPAVERYRDALRKIVTVSNAYLREVLKPSTGRTFTVYVEPLVGARSNFRNYGDQYSIVVGASNEMPLDAMQHAYLHFMLDPIVLHNRPLVDRKSALLAVAARAPQFPPEYQNDFIDFTDECFIKAVELRLRHLSPQDLEAALRDADQSGFILVRPFVRSLQNFEKAEPSMTYYFPDLVAGIDVDAEQKRMQGVSFAAARPGPAVDEHNTVATSEIDQWVAEGDREIAQKDAAAAKATFEKALAKYPDDPRALYGMAIASVLSGDGDRAKELFDRIVAMPAAAPSTDPSIVAWSHVYLGRIHDLEEERAMAVNEYKAALAIDGAPESARAAAQTGVTSPYKPAHAASEGQPQQ